MDIFVLGGSGLVGRNLMDEAARRGHGVTGTYNRHEDGPADIRLDKTNSGRVADVLSQYQPDVVVDTAAFHAVDDCESERQRAFEVNAIGTRNAAVAADEIGAHFIYLSTDYVFPGNPGEAPYTEADPVSPINFYAQTKYAGEQAAKIADDWTILRTSVVYGVERRNFANWVLSELEAGNEVNIVDDQVSTPTYSPDLARAAVEVARSGTAGVYHAAGPTSLSRYEFTCLLADAFDYDRALVNRISTEELGQEAPRPADGSLDSRRLYERLDFGFRSPSEAFEHMVDGAK